LLMKRSKICGKAKRILKHQRCRPRTLSKPK
jgi:hypothetical protein